MINLILDILNNKSIIKLCLWHYIKINLEKIGIVLEILLNSNGVKTLKVGDLELFLAGDGRTRGDLNDLFNVIVNQIFKILSLFKYKRTGNYNFSLELTCTWVWSILYFDLNLVASRPTQHWFLLAQPEKLVDPGVGRW